ncbi:leucyl aminopeptidase [Candidatus Nomurabacteria bacterium]|nr:leucyl aminopeptidase [Candidatus Nomurabacteria bacterium]
MELKFCKSNTIEQGTDLLFYPVLNDQIKINLLLKNLTTDQSVLSRLDKEKFTGKKAQIFSFQISETTVIFYGTGNEQKMNQEDWRQASGFLGNYILNNKIKSLALEPSAWFKSATEIEKLAQSISEGLNLALYNFDKYQNKKEKENNLEVIFVCLDAKKRNLFKKFWERGLFFAQGTMLARDLINEPAGVMTPTFLAKQAEEIANKNHKEIKLKILEKEAVEKLGMQAFLGVDRGSEEPLKFIHLKYLPKQKAKDKVAIVGKGITFDSGGLNIKVGEGMTDMKMDMGGAATVLGLFSVLAELKPKIEVHGIIAACENMPSGSALKPGDVVTNLQGKTIEIGNTDAEGRVTLADSLAYAQKQKVSTVVDLATLTGACIVALGSEYAALYANQDLLAKDLLKAAETSGEKMWLMPLPEEYRELNKSSIADIRNIPNSRGGGSITAALFLSEFIEAGTAWAHLDIAGPAYAEKALNTYTPIGGVGYGVRTLLEWLDN